MINVQIVYALPENSTIIDCKVNADSNILEVINQSDILTACSIDLSQHKVGIYGKLVELTDSIKMGDRIEIYRALINDPKEIRRRRANAKKN